MLFFHLSMEHTRNVASVFIVLLEGAIRVALHRVDADFSTRVFPRLWSIDTASALLKDYIGLDHFFLHFGTA